MENQSQKQKNRQRDLKAVCALALYAVSIILVFAAERLLPYDFKAWVPPVILACMAAVFPIFIIGRISYIHVIIAMVIEVIFNSVLPKSPDIMNGEWYEAICIISVWLYESVVFILARRIRGTKSGTDTQEFGAQDPLYAQLSQQGEGRMRECLSALCTQSAENVMNYFCAAYRLQTDTAAIQLGQMNEKLKGISGFALDGINCSGKKNIDGIAVFFSCDARYSVQLPDGQAFSVRICCNHIWQKHREFEGVVQITLTDCQSGEMMNVGSTVLPYEDC